MPDMFVLYCKIFLCTRYKFSTALDTPSKHIQTGLNIPAVKFTAIGIKTVVNPNCFVNTLNLFFNVTLDCKTISTRPIGTKNLW